MFAESACPSEVLSFAEIETSEVHHWPIVRAYADRLGLRPLINRLVPSGHSFDPGLIVLAMVVDTLSGRSPLYHLESFFADKDTELLLGEAVDPSMFNDDNAGAVLDLLYAAGTQKIYSEVAVAALRAFAIPTEHGHFDTTSVSVHGEYHSAEGPGAPFRITHGWSKDKRPDLKQFLLSMLCVGGDVPIIGRCEDGNASDKRLNNALLSQISQHLKRFGIDERAFIYVADSALVSRDNLAALDEGIRFITRCPASYAECNRVIQAAVEADQWEEIGRIAQSPATRRRPGAYYRAWESEVRLYEKPYRAVVVHSSAHVQEIHVQSI